MDSINEQTGNTATGRFNYFNYFTEIEEEFVRRRGKPLLISPMDWALIESWKAAGIPLHIVLRAINQAFDGYDARARKYRKVNSVFYCQQEVEAMYAAYLLSQVGGKPGATDKQASTDKRTLKAKQDSAFPKEALLDFIARADKEFEAALAMASGAGRINTEDALSRARARLAEIEAEIKAAAQVDDEALEHDLDAIDRMLLQSITGDCGQNQIETLRAEAESQLQAYRKKMDRAIYERTMENFISRRLREMNAIPRLSLFYI